MTRTGENVIEIDAGDAPLIFPMFYRLVRSQRDPLAEGDVIRQGRLQARILKMSRGEPLRVEFTVDALTDPKAVCLLTLRDNRFESYALPPIGEVDTIEIKLFGE